MKDKITTLDIWNKAKELNAVDFAEWFIGMSKNIANYTNCVYMNDEGRCWCIKGKCNPYSPDCDYREEHPDRRGGVSGVHRYYEATCDKHEWEELPNTTMPVLRCKKCGAIRD
jgi:hypothetical protein